MGWTSMKMNQPIKEWFKETWEYFNNGEQKYRVLDSALVQRKVLYGAIQIIKTNEVFCAVYLVHWSRDYMNFSYKDLTEFSGPVEIDCPQKIFKLLTPLNDINDPNNWAREWRKNVQMVHDKRKEVSKIGSRIIRTLNPIYFTRGHYQYFRKEGRKYFGGVMIESEFRPICRINGFNPSKYVYDLY